MHSISYADRKNISSWFTDSGHKPGFTHFYLVQADKIVCDPVHLIYHRANIHARLSITILILLLGRYLG